MRNTYYVYILASYSGVLYIGVTNNLVRRVSEHQIGLSDFTQRYGVTKLVYFEETDDVTAAIGREQELKGWRREKKAALIEQADPYWEEIPLA